MSDAVRPSSMLDRLPGMAYRCHHDDARTLLELAGQVEALTGYRAAELRDGTLCLSDLVSPDDQERVRLELQDGLASNGAFDLEYTIITADGSRKPVHEHGELILGEDGEAQLVGFISDNRARTAQQDRQRLAQRAVVQAAENPLQASGDLYAYAQVLARLLCATLQVQIAGIWLLDEECRTLTQFCGYDAALDRFDNGIALSALDYPRYFDELMSGRAIAAADARHDPATSEFREGYLVPLGILSMLDAAIRVGGRIVGMVCCEHTGHVRHWYADEISFAGEIADQMAQAMVARDKQAALSELQRERGSIRARTDFLATMSHEIRTPMNGVLGMAELLTHTPLNEQQRDYVGTILESGKMLLHIVNDILDYAKIEAGKFPIHPQPCHIRDKLSALCHQFALRAADAGLQLQLHIDPGLPPVVQCDAERVQQVLMNLIGNAIKFTPQGFVRVHAQRRRGDAGDHLVISVIDSGTGIEPELLPTLFEPFEQGRQSDGRQERGTGLGLAISRRLAELMGGTLTAVSTPGRGSTFTVSLPLEVGGSTDVPAAVPAAGAARLRPLRVLVAEDNHINQKVILGMLQKYHGIAADCCDNGEQALARVAEGTPYDLVLMDCEMPVMDGYEATRRIRALPAPRNAVAIAALTAHAVPELRDKAFDAGVDHYLTKPLSRGAVEELIRTVGEAVQAAATDNPS